MTCNLYSSIEAAKEAMEKLSTETKEYFERQTELINKAFTGDEQTTKTKPEIKAIVVHHFLKNDTIKDLEKDKKMRLIDADALREEILNDNTYDNDTVNYYLGTVDDTETAYDVDKVVDELKKNKVNCKNSDTIFDTWDYVKLKKAIELVKRDDGDERHTR